MNDETIHDHDMPNLEEDLSILDVNKQRTFYGSLGPHTKDQELIKEKIEQKRIEKYVKKVVIPVQSETKRLGVLIWVLFAVIIGGAATEGLQKTVAIVGGYIHRNNPETNLAIQATSTSFTLLPRNSGVTNGLGSDDDVVTTDYPVTKDNTHYELIDTKKSLQMFSPAYLIGDINTGEVVISKNETLVSPMASVSKLMTAVVTKENIDLQHEAVVTKEAYATFGNEGELNPGEQILTGDLMYPLLIESSNKGAEVLAYDYGHQDFMNLMNLKAAEIGMASTFYEDPSGLSPNNVSTVTDLFRLGQYVKKNHPEIWDITRVREYTIFKHAWKNQNHSLTYSNFKGGKNGFIDEAKKTTVSLFDVQIPEILLEASSTIATSSSSTLPKKVAVAPKLITKTFALVILKSDDRDHDIAALLDYIKKNVQYVDSPPH